MSRKTYQVREVARLAKVTVRTLHHYDAIGLLVPSARTESGYRLYDDADLLRLHQIRAGRELGLALEEIRSMLDDPTRDKAALLLEQRERLVERARDTEAMIRSLDAALAALKGEDVKPANMFDGFDPEKYEDEAKERWGDTDAYQESTRRTKRYRPEDWKALKEEADDIFRRVADKLAAGAAATDDEVRALAEEHRMHIDRWFYPCSKAMHANLADLYEADDRFAANLDKYAEGLTPFFSAAVRANSQA